MTKEVIIQKESELLTFLIEEMHFARNKAKSLLSNKLISINGKTISQYNHLLKENDRLLVLSSPIQNAGARDIEVLFEDEDIIAINKPAGLLAISSEKEKEKTAYKMVMNYLKAKDKHNKVFVLHRLDKETSGVLVFAKNEKVKKTLQENWNSIVSTRAYYAVVEGQLQEKEKRIENYLRENKIGIVYVCDKNEEGAKKAITNYSVIKENKNYSLLDIHIETGRKNQIRVSLQNMNHPIVGDEKYGSKINPIKRLALVAYELSFTNPQNKKAYHFKASLPVSFHRLMK